MLQMIIDVVTSSRSAWSAYGSKGQLHVGKMCCQAFDHNTNFEYQSFDLCYAGTCILASVLVWQIIHSW